MIFKRLITIIFSISIFAIMLVNLLWYFGIVANPEDHQGYYFGFTSLLQWIDDMPQDLSPAWWLQWFESLYDSVAFWTSFAEGDIAGGFLQIIALPVTLIYHVVTVIIDLILLIIHTITWLFQSLLGGYGIDMEQIPHFYN